VAIGLPLVLVTGNLVAQEGQVTWLILPFLNLLATGLPVLWLALMSQRGLPGISPQRTWGLFTSGMALAPIFVIVTELAAMALIIIAVGVWISSQPGLEHELIFLVQRLRSAPTEEAILRILSPYLARPGVWIIGLFYAAVIVPILEEIIKPIGMWLLAGRRLTPADGFVAGMLSGAGFAFFENLGFTSLTGADWAVIAITRIATATLHMFISGLFGYALVCAWRQGQFLRLGIAFSISVALHGLWNGLAAFGLTASSLPQTVSMPAPLSQWGYAALVGQGVLAVIGFILLVGSNRLLRRQKFNQADTR
jgi:RsiW-degrading membrane proteinase PrsW (M82 family)